MHLFSVIISILAYLFFPAYIRADAIYAVSSLHCYIHALLEPPAEESIHFSPEDVAHLWNRACACAGTYQKTTDAYSSYAQALEHAPNSKEFKRLCRLSCSLLALAWDFLLHEEATPSALQLAKYSGKSPYANFDDHPFLDDGMKQRIRPHLIAPKHAAKKCLDSLFKTSNPIRDIEAFNLAGFKKVAKHSSQCIVAKHSHLGHYLAKLYLFDSLPDKQQMLSWEALCTRCESAAGVRALIKKHKIRHFEVPGKWVYVLPAHVLASATPEEHLHPILLVVEDMDLAGKHKSIQAWQTKITRRHLDELYCILCHGYGSTKLPQNIPYTKHHLFALIDTEYPKRTFDYAKVKRFITLEMQEYWDGLVRTGASPL